MTDSKRWYAVGTFKASTTDVFLGNLRILKNSRSSRPKLKRPAILLKRDSNTGVFL